MDIPETGSYVRGYLTDKNGHSLFFLADEGDTQYLVYEHPSDPSVYVSRETLIAEGHRLGMTHLWTGGGGGTVEWSGK